jgi:hypothetical protein
VNIIVLKCLHESGAEESIIFILKDLGEIKMVDGGVRLNAYHA